MLPPPFDSTLADRTKRTAQRAAAELRLGDLGACREVESLEVVVCLWIHPGRVAWFEAYEHKAARIMQRHGGAIQTVVRVSDASPSQNSQPFEVHVLRFPSLEAFHSYRADAELAELATERNAAISRTEVLLGETGPRYQTWPVLEA